MARTGSSRTINTPNDSPSDAAMFMQVPSTPLVDAPPASRSKRSTFRQQQTRQQRRRNGHVHVVTLKERVQSFLDSPLGIALETINVLLSVVLVIIAVVQSYEHEDKQHTSMFEIICTGIFTVDFGLHLYASDKRVKFVTSPMSIIDLITILPTYITLFLQSFDFSFMSMLRILRIFRMLAVLRLYRIVQSYRGADYELGVLVFMIFTVIFVAAGIIQVLDEDYYKEQGQEPLQFHQCVYFVFVTMSTVGYGDITPRTTASQLFMIVIICVIVIVIPPQVQRLNELSQLQNAYMHSYSVRKSGVGSGGHVIVTGSISYDSVSSFLSEFYRPRQGKVNMDVVILADHIPSERLVTVLRNVKYQRRVTYLKGSLLNDKDAQRVHVESAGAVFILADKKNVKHAEAADAHTILQALAVDKFKFRNETSLIKGGTIRCFLQVLSPQRTRGLRTITGVEVALNTPRLRTAILAKSIICPGATALTLNLVCSLKDDDVSKALISNVPWIAEYSYGLQHQLYPVILPQYFDDMKYERAVLKLYQHFNVMLIAVYDRNTTQVGAKRISICPFGHLLHENDLAFVIALSASEAQHAVNTLFYVDASEASLRHVSQTQRATNKETPPTLVFSTDTVLGRQSFIRERALSVELHSDSESTFDEVSVSECEDTAFGKGQQAPQEVKRNPTCEFDASAGHLLQRHATPPMLPPFLHHLHSVGGNITDWYLAPQELRKLHDHIIICGPFSQGHQFALYLDDLYRNERRHETRPRMILLVKRLPTERDFRHLPSPLPENVFVEKGVSQNVEDLLHVRAHAARAVLMIPGNWKNHVDELRDETADEVNEHLLDYQVIMSTLSMRTVQELHQKHLGKQASPSQANVPITCSVVKWHESITYFAHKSQPRPRHCREQLGPRKRTGPIKSFGSWLQNNSTIGRNSQLNDSTMVQQPMLVDFPNGPSPLFSPTYAAGQVFVDGVLDTLLCQSFFNPYIIDLVRALMGDYYYTVHTKAQNFESSMMEYFDDSTHGSASPPSPTSHPVDPPSPTEGDSPLLAFPVLRTATIARELDGQSFATIFAKALEQDILVIAIFRRPDDPRRGNVLPYVFTCPKSAADVTVERGDTLHVLSKHMQPICIH